MREVGVTDIATFCVSLISKGALCSCEEREPPVSYQRHFRISSLCVCARVPFVYEPSVNVKNIAGQYTYSG